MLGVEGNRCSKKELPLGNFQNKIGKYMQREIGLYFFFKIFIRLKYVYKPGRKATKMFFGHAVWLVGSQFPD